MRFRDLLAGTVRPISLLAPVPVLVGAALAGDIDWGLLYGSLGAIFSVGLINASNNLVDRRQDRYDPAKRTLAVSHPVAAYWVTLLLLPGIALTLRRVEYNNVLLACLTYTGYWYSYLFGRVPYLKRIVVALCVSGTSFMFAQSYPPALWVWAACIAVFIFIRETYKDQKDMATDHQFRFAYSKKIDPWCFTAPMLATAIYLACVIATRHSVTDHDMAIGYGLTVAVWSYIQIRARLGRYKVRFAHKAQAGRLGMLLALVGLMPSFVSVPLLLLTCVNSASILYRSFLPLHMNSTSLAVVHDALLWASLPLLVATQYGVVTPILIGVAAFIFLVSLIRQGNLMTAHR